MSLRLKMSVWILEAIDYGDSPVIGVYDCRQKAELVKRRYQKADSIRDFLITEWTVQ